MFERCLRHLNGGQRGACGPCASGADRLLETTTMGILPGVVPPEYSCVWSSSRRSSGRSTLVHPSVIMPVRVPLLFSLLAAVLAAEDHTGHNHGSMEDGYEWAGIFATPEDFYLWTAQRKEVRCVRVRFLAYGPAIGERSFVSAICRCQRRGLTRPPPCGRARTMRTRT
jgi:hypothetical protein